jgi:hypothetical protein
MKVPSVAELKAAAAAAKHDSFGIAADPEALMHLANVSRRAFVDNKDLLALSAWADSVQDVAAMQVLDEHIRRWVEDEVERLLQSGQLLMDLVQTRVLPEARLVRTRFAAPSAARCEQLATEIKVAWYTAPASKVVAAGD